MNALLSDELTEPVAVFSGIAIDVPDSRKFLTVRLADVETVRGPEPDSGRRFIGFRLFHALALRSNDWSENQNAFFALLHEASQFVPRVETSDVRSRWLLRCDQHHVP